MNNKKWFVGVEVAGVKQTHLPHPTGQYATLCGMDRDDPDPSVAQRPVSPGLAVDCNECRMIFVLCKRYGPKDFSLD